MPTCLTCTTILPPPETTIIGGYPFTIAATHCDPCIEYILHETEKAERVAAAKAAWTTATPAEYRDTDLARLHSQAVAAAKSWDPTGTSGFGLVGPARLTKTRTMYAIALKRAAWMGQSIAAINHPQHAAAVQKATSGGSEDRDRAQGVLDECRTARVLLLDDLGKGSFTARAVVELWELLEHRSSRQKPTLWTSNAGSSSLLARLAEADARAADTYGAAILGRLKDFSPGIILKSNHQPTK